MRVFRPIAGVTLVLAAAAAWPSAQSAPQPQTPQTFRAGIDVVSVDARVTDGHGNAVLDLTADDFEIKDSGKVQKIDTFKLVKIDDTDDSPSSTREIMSLADQAREAARDDVRLIVIFLDDYHIQRNNSLAMRDELAHFVREISPRDLVAIMYPLTPVMALTFSRDHFAQAKLIEEFFGRKGEFNIQNAFDERVGRASPAGQQAARDQLTIGALKGLMVYLGGLRDGQKTVLYVGEGVGEPVPQSGRTASNPVNPPNTDARYRECDGLPPKGDGLLACVVQMAITHNTAFYTLDPRGVESGNLDMRDRTAIQAGRTATNTNRMQEELRNLAFRTDGRAMVGTKNYEPVLRQMLSDTASYYLLGYTASNPKHDGLFHEISVHVKRGGTNVRARHGYWAFNDDAITHAAAPSKPGPPDAIVQAMAALMPHPTAYPVKTSLLMARGKDGATDVTLVWERATGAASTAAIESVQVTAGQSDGTKAFEGAVSRTAPDQTGGAVTFAARPGALKLTLAATAGGGVLDRDEQTVEIRDFTAVGVALSTPTLFRGRTVRDIQRIRDSASSVPAVSREFSRTERLLLRVHAYGPGGAAPAVTLRILNGLGEPRASLAAPVAGADGSLESEIVLASLAAGDYVIEIAAQTGDSRATTLVAIRISG